MTGIKWRNRVISPYFSRTTFSPVVNKPAVSAFRVPKGYGCSYFNRCLNSLKKTIGTLVVGFSTSFG